MGLKNCEIKLDNPWNTYYAGQTINGQVILVFDSPKKVRGICIKVFGDCFATPNGRCDGNFNQIIPNEKFKIYKNYLMGNSKGPETELPEGTITYDFNFDLLNDLPVSHEGKNSKIRYYIRIILEFKNDVDDWYQRRFKIAPHLDLNLDPSLKLPLNYRMQKRFYSFWKCCTGLLKFDLNLPMTGFVPNSSIPINANCENKSGIKIKSVRIYLRERYFYDRPQYFGEKVDIACKELGPVGPYENKKFENYLEIPTFLPLSTVKSKVIFIYYELLIRLVVDWNHRDLRGIIPVVIGTVPIDPNFELPPNIESKLLQDKPPQQNCCNKHVECYNFIL